MRRIDTENDLISVIKDYLIEVSNIEFGTIFENGCAIECPQVCGTDTKFVKIEEFLEYCGCPDRFVYMPIEWKRETVVRKVCFFTGKEWTDLRKPVYLFIDHCYISGPVAFYPTENPNLITTYYKSLNFTIILENEIEVELYNCKTEIEKIEENIKEEEKFLNDPWKEFESKKAAYQQKLEKAKAATEYKIKEVTGHIEEEKKKIEELNNKLAGFFTGNKK